MYVTALFNEYKVKPARTGLYPDELTRDTVKTRPERSKAICIRHGERFYEAVAVIHLKTKLNPHKLILKPFYVQFKDQPIKEHVILDTEKHDDGLLLLLGAEIHRRINDKLEALYKLMQQQAIIKDIVIDFIDDIAAETDLLDDFSSDDEDEF